jgi:hypothetical protein
MCFIDVYCMVACRGTLYLAMKLSGSCSCLRFMANVGCSLEPCSCSSARSLTPLFSASPLVASWNGMHLSFLFFPLPIPTHMLVLLCQGAADSPCPPPLHCPGGGQGSARALLHSTLYGIHKVMQWLGQKTGAPQSWAPTGIRYVPYPPLFHSLPGALGSLLPKQSLFSCLLMLCSLPRVYTVSLSQRARALVAPYMLFWPATALFSACLSFSSLSMAQYADALLRSSVRLFLSCTSPSDPQDALWFCWRCKALPVSLY